MTVLRILRAGPLATLQDAGRPGMLRHGISASGPMDRASFARAGDTLGAAGSTGIEFTTAGISVSVEQGSVAAAFDGGTFTLAINGAAERWPTRVLLAEGDVVEITPGAAGNYGYLRFDREIEVPVLMGSRSTNLVAALGGYGGRALAAGDILTLGPAIQPRPPNLPHPAGVEDGPIRVVWGLHAELFGAVRQRFVAEPFTVSSRLDRMGVRLRDMSDVFSGQRRLSLVSDAVVPGDIQILGDGTPIVLMRDHQPTGGYPRIATVISADFDRFAQLRPGTSVRFEPVTVPHAQALLNQRKSQ